MAIISETELQRRLRKLENDSGTSSSSTANIKKVGDHYEYENDWIYIAYTSALTNLSSGTIPNQSDASDFQYTPFDSAGNLLAYRGSYTSKSIYASGDPTDYTWEAINSGNLTASSQRYYTTSLSLLFELGTPDDPGTGITWTQLTSGNSAPGNAIWLAEQYTINSIKSNWNIAPLKGNDKSFIVASGTKSGSNKPTLGDSTWITDAIAVVTSFTGVPYSNQKEFGYGTAVTIEYDDGKLHGILKLSGANDVWVAASTFIDGDLMVDGTVVADKIAANAITADKIGANTIIGSHIQSGSIDAGHLSADSVTVDKIDVDGKLTISDATGSFAFKKTTYSDYSTNGVFLGNRTGSTIPVFLAGNTTSYIQVDDNGVVIVGADFADSTGQSGNNLVTITAPAD